MRLVAIIDDPLQVVSLKGVLFWYYLILMVFVALSLAMIALSQEDLHR
jgi:hypothetical protein